MASRRLLLSDATVPRNFCKAGANTARVLLAYLGPDRLFMVQDVYDELARHVEQTGDPAVAAFLAEFPDDHVLELSFELKVRVAEILGVPRYGHPDEDRGETATVLYAEERQKETGDTFMLLMDDRGGKALAKDRGFDFETSVDVLLAMVCAEVLQYKDGERVWRATTNPKLWKLFKERVEARCPDRVP